MNRASILGLFALLLAAPPAFPQASNLANCKYYMKVQQDFEQASQYCGEAITENPEDPEARFFGAWCLAEMGDLTAARESFFWLIERKDSDDKAIKKHAKWAVERVDGYYARYFNKGIELLQAEDLAGARDAFEWATQIDPRKTGAFLNLGYTQTQLGQLDEAIESFHTAIGIDPSGLDARNYQWDALSRKLEALRNADAPDTAEVARVRADLRLTLEKVLELDPGGKGAPDAHLQLGDLDLADGKREEAFLHLRKAVELDPNSVVNLVNVGIEFYQDDEYEPAVDALALVREYVTDPADDIWVKSTWVLGLSQYELERWDDALGSFEELLAHDPDNLEYLPRAAMSASKAGAQEKRDQYMIHFEQVKEAAVTGDTVE
jgi:tetratricopeptide (TPR) repeat protein